VLTLDIFRKRFYDFDLMCVVDSVLTSDIFRKRFYDFDLKGGPKT